MKNPADAKELKFLDFSHSEHSFALAICFWAKANKLKFPTRETL